MSTNIREKRNQPVRERKKRAKIIKFLVRIIPYLLAHHLQEKNKLKFDRKNIFSYHIPAALAPPRRKFFLTSGRAN
jgi:hypothetical protein